MPILELLAYYGIEWTPSECYNQKKSGHLSSESLDEDLHARILALTLLIASEDSMITLPIKIFDKDLHASMQMQDEVKG